MALLKRLRGERNAGAQPSGSAQMEMLRRLPQILRFIPGTAQDVRAYFLTLQYWLAGSDDNVANMVRFLVDRYADGRAAACAAPPRRAAGRVPRGRRLPPAPDGPHRRRAPTTCPRRPSRTATVGLLVMRSYLLAGNTAHYDGVIAALEARGLRVIPAFATGLDARPAIERYLPRRDGAPTVDALVSLTGFSLVGGPAYNDAQRRRGHAGARSTCPTSRRTRSSSRRSSSGRRPTAACCRSRRR